MRNLIMLMAIVGLAFTANAQETKSQELVFSGLTVSAGDSTFTFVDNTGAEIKFKTCPTYQLYKYNLANDLLYKGATFKVTFDPKKQPLTIISMAYLHGRNNDASSDEEDDADD